MNPQEASKPPTEKERLSALLKYVQDTLGDSQKELSERIGTSDNNVSKYLNPKDPIMPNVGTREGIARVCSMLPAGSEFKWISTLDDLQSYLRGSDRPPATSTIQVQRWVTICEDVSELLDVSMAIAARVKYLNLEQSSQCDETASPSPTE